MKPYIKQILTTILLLQSLAVFAEVDSTTVKNASANPIANIARESLAAAPRSERAGEEQQTKFSTWGIAALSWDSHLVSYGRDVWGAGDDLNGATSGLIHPWIQLGMSNDQYRFFGGAWLDINDNAEKGISGDVQEVDLWIGMNRTLGKFNLGLNLQRWHWGDEVEIVLDSSVTFDDSGLLFQSLALNPGLTLHSQLASDISDEKNVLIARITPGLPLSKSKTQPIWLSIPIAVGFQQAGFKNNPAGHSYSSVSADLYLPLKTSSQRKGNWTMNISLSWFDTDPQRIPENPEQSFVTGKVGILHFF